MDYDKYARLVQKLEPAGKLLRIWPLAGGVSAEVTALEIALADGRTRKLVVRQHGSVDRQQNPQIAATEYRLLQLLQVVDVPAPAPCYLDTSSTIFALPYIVLEYIDGEPDFSPVDMPGYIEQFAAHLAQIHRIDAATHDLSFLPQQTYQHALWLRNLPLSPDEASIRAALAAMPLPPTSEQALLHGDYWPGNILWRDGRLVGIIDWEDAQVGDPLADVANSRLEIAWAFRMDAMQAFTELYQTLTGRDLRHLPYWDLASALRTAGKFAGWAGSAAREDEMRDVHRRFVEQALSTLRRG